MNPAVGMWQGVCSTAGVVNDRPQELTEAFARWKLDLPVVRRQVYRAPTPRERERWHALWLLAQGWSATDVAVALERDPHTIGEWQARFCREGPASMSFEQSGGSPPP